MDSAALPLGDVRRETRRAMMTTRQLQTSFGRADGVVLEPVTVFSNSTEMMRSEQMLTLNSSVRLESPEVGGQMLVNGTNIPFEDCLLLRMNEQKQLESEWVGKLDADSRKNIQWQPTSIDTATAQWDSQLHSSPERPGTEELQNMQGLWIGGLLNRIARKYPMLPGACVLIGHTRQPIGSLKIAPKQDQYDSDCVVVVHLSQPILSNIQPDISIISRGEAVDSAGESGEKVKEDTIGDTGSTLETENGLGEPMVDQEASND